MNRLTLVPILALLVPQLGFAKALSLNPEWAKESASCTGAPGKQTVFIFKQWHLSPATLTRDVGAGKKLPQFENQHAIYQQLSQWIRQNELNTLFAEGCSGEIKDGTPLTFNGWSYGDLLLMASAADYVDVLTHIPLKLEAEFDKRVATYCGDDAKLVKEHSLMFSDVRGNIGFLTRINQHAEDEAKVRPYLDSVAKIHKLKGEVSVATARAKLISVLGEKLERIKALFSQRNQSFVESVKKKGGAVSAIVIGGLHAEDLKKKFEGAKIGCVVVEPKGYLAEDEKLIDELEQLIKDQN